MVQAGMDVRNLAVHSDPDIFLGNCLKRKSKNTSKTLPIVSYLGFYRKCLENVTIK